MRVAAVDDEIHVLERFERMVSNFPDVTLCGLFDTGDALLEYLKNNTLDVVFLDIEMHDKNGMQLSGELHEIDDNLEVVFVTAYKQYALEAFEHEAIDYITKPFTEERLAKTISRLQKNKKPAIPIQKPYMQCFGDFEVFLNGAALPWKHSKAKEILAYLVHKNGVPVSWEKIADAVWPEFDCEKAQSNFHATSYLLRKFLEQHGLSHIFECKRGNYRILTNEIDCDAYTLEKILKPSYQKSKEDVLLIEQFLQNGYLENSGYQWAYAKAAELINLCQRD